MSRRKGPRKKPSQTQQKLPMSIAVEPKEDVDPFNDPNDRQVRHLFAEVQDVLTSHELQRASLYLTAMEMDLISNERSRRSRRRQRTHRLVRRLRQPPRLTPLISDSR